MGSRRVLTVVFALAIFASGCSSGDVSDGEGAIGRATEPTGTGPRADTRNQEPPAASSRLAAHDEKGLGYWSPLGQPVNASIETAALEALPLPEGSDSAAPAGRTPNQPGADRMTPKPLGSRLGPDTRVVPDTLRVRVLMTDRTSSHREPFHRSIAVVPLPRYAELGSRAKRGQWYIYPVFTSHSPAEEALVGAIFGISEKTQKIRYLDTPWAYFIVPQACEDCDFKDLSAGTAYAGYDHDYADRIRQAARNSRVALGDVAIVATREMLPVDPDLLVYLPEGSFTTTLSEMNQIEIDCSIDRLAGLLIDDFDGEISLNELRDFRKKTSPLVHVVGNVANAVARSFAWAISVFRPSVAEAAVPEPPSHSADEVAKGLCPI